MSFSPDGKWVIAQGGAPEWNVTLWNWERCKQLACVPAKALGSDAGAVLQVRFSAHDTSLASCAGEGVFRTFKCAESGVRALPDVKLPPAKSGAREEPAAIRITPRTVGSPTIPRIRVTIRRAGPNDASGACWARTPASCW
jgi:hypothetical protein